MEWEIMRRRCWICLASSLFMEDYFLESLAKRRAAVLGLGAGWGPRGWRGKSVASAGGLS
jgi:hypothetical protein